MLKIEMDLPPSLNNLFVNIKGKGRIKASHYKNWQIATLWHLKNCHRGEFIPSPYSAVIRVGKCSQARDLDNVGKGALDTLKTAGIIKDDNLKNMHLYAAIRDFENVPVGKIIIELTPHQGE